MYQFCDWLGEKQEVPYCNMVVETWDGRVLRFVVAHFRRKDTSTKSKESGTKRET